VYIGAHRFVVKYRKLFTKSWCLDEAGVGKVCYDYL